MTDISVESRSFGTDDRPWLIGEAVGHQAPTLSTWSPGLIDFALFTAATHHPDGFLRSGQPLGKVTATGRLGPYASRTSEVQTINLGAATAGTITIGFDGETTAAIAFNASASAVQSALDALSNVDPGDITVTGGPLPGTVTLSFGGRYTGRNVAAVTVTPTGLTGGTVTVATTTEGGSAVTDGRTTCVGLLYNATRVPASTATRVAATVVDAFARVSESRLPAGHGLDAAGKTDLPHIKFVA